MGAFGEFNRGNENQVAYVRRRKSGLEVPLVGRFYGENKRLVFAPPLWHDALVGVCLVGGIIYTLLSAMGTLEVPGGLFTTVAVLAAGIWGALSNERMICDLRTKTYVRFEGMGPGKQVIRGSISEIDAVVLTAEQYSLSTGFSGGTVIYRLILHWKGQRHPPLIIERESRNLPIGAPLNQGAQRMLHKGMRYAQALGLPYYDNSNMIGKSPVPIV
ncbi:MAG TPA: hypothetical protein VGL56_11965 [Fimbriimonadaceae bacterium]|jgi:hypothetical protein